MNVSFKKKSAKTVPQPARTGGLSAAVLYSCWYLVLTSMPSMAAAAPVTASLDKVILYNLKQLLRASFV